jgi:S-formylglutathione hydrolase FrmB
MDKTMKKIFSVFMLGIVGFTISAQSVLKTDLTFESKILDKPVKCSVYLPAGYETDSRAYPVLYLLHGFTGDHQDWTQFGEIKHIADREMIKEEVTPMIIVMPDAGLSWYLNNHDGSIRFEDFFVQELIPSVEEQYRIKAEKQFRAIAGLSMGGHGALIYALKYPELFTAVAALSASIRTDQEFVSMPDDQWDRMFALPFGDHKGKKRITDHLKANTVLNIVSSKQPSALDQLDYYIDCGDDDHLIVCNMRLHEALLAKKVPHEFRVRDGAHEWDYWRSALPDVLTFISARFQR